MGHTPVMTVKKVKRIKADHEMTTLKVLLLYVAYKSLSITWLHSKFEKNSLKLVPGNLSYMFYKVLNHCLPKPLDTI